MTYPDYPFTPKRFEVRPRIAMSFLDEGPREGDIVVMLHGNPSWSFYWRHLVSGLSDKYRCIVPDHVGMGLSDRPSDAQYAYILQSRVDDLDALLAHLGISGQVTLAVHDWGGMIGFGWALSHMAQVKRLVITNTSAFPLPRAKRFPKRLAMGRDSRLGGWLIRRFNLFARGAARFGTERSLSADVRNAYASVYEGWDEAIATLRFMQDIPLQEGDASMPLVAEVGRRLHEFADHPAFIGWGLGDFVFDQHFLAGFTAALPNAEVHAFDDANHYVLEDKHEVLVPAIRKFMDSHPLPPARLQAGETVG